jgi:allantoinase
VTDLVVRGGTIDGVVADIAIDGEAIAAIGPDLPGGREEIDAHGLLVLPGVVDAHVHLNDPGRADWEGFETGTRALAAGGATTCVDMPLNASPPTLDAASFEAKRVAAEGRIQVDVALWGGLVPGPLDRLDELAACGVVGFKAFMTASGIDDFERVDDDVLGEGMRRAASLGLPVAVHAEDEELTASLTGRASREGGTGVRDWLATRPVAAETNAIARVIALAEETGCGLHVVHVSCGSGVALIAQARARGVDVTCETCPHYLVFTEDDVEAVGALLKCTPPLRDVVEQASLLDALHSGLVDTIGSDHSPAPASMKDTDDFFEVWGGISGCQSLLALVLDLDLDPTQVVRLTAQSPATRLGLGGKGSLTPGADADIVLIDASHPTTLQAADLHYRHRHSPYLGRVFIHRIARTILRGQTIWDGTRFARPGGRVVSPRRSRPTQD